MAKYSRLPEPEKMHECKPVIKVPEPEVMHYNRRCGKLQTKREPSYGRVRV